MNIVRCSVLLLFCSAVVCAVAEPRLAFQVYAVRDLCEKDFVGTLKVFVGGRLAKTVTLPDDPADSRGILSWLSQPHDRRLREVGSYGYLVEVDVPASAVKGGKVDIRLESDNGLAVYGPAFGRYPMHPHVAPVK